MVVMNFSPLICYENKRMIQLAIIPGPKEPKDLVSFLEPMLKELESLQDVGMDVKGDDGNIYHAKVHLLIGTGDIPAAAKLMLYKGHNSR
ncbi:hypothetical protein INT45_011543 [Circinella minor]|uniref:Uncharacterized protein n=1 Tax=Circinella minor TaxID=1195481 RepID=A0A8H7S7K5_9FUNG|nr:hypothetical protein INT45_011543 [Circinella minor]